MKKHSVDDWCRPRSHEPLKMKNIDVITEMFSQLHRYDHIDHIDTRKTLLFCEGSPSIRLIQIFKSSHFRYIHQPTNIWVNFKASHNDYEYYIKNINKYDSGSQGQNLSFDYDGLFFLQNPAGPDKYHTIKVLKWATENKCRIVFKAHPCPGDPISNKAMWDQFNTLGLISDYTIFVDDIDNQVLIDNASFVLSSQSATMVHALLSGKPCATFKGFDWSEVIPKINHCDQIKNLRALDKDMLIKFLSWHRHVYSIELGNENFHRRVEHRINNLMTMPTTYDILFCETNEYRQSSY